MTKAKEVQHAFRMNCEVVLSEAELKATAKALAESLNRRHAIEAQLAEFKAQKKAESAAVDSVIERATLLLNSGREFRMVECQWIYDWSAGKKTGFRTDTGEAVAKSDISDEERQMDFAPKTKRGAV